MSLASKRVKTSSTAASLKKYLIRPSSNLSTPLFFQVIGWSVQTYARYLPGRIENWRLGPGGDDLRSPPFFKRQPDSPHFNQLFAALYDLIFSKLTNMGRLIPSRERTLRQIFMEKVSCMNDYLASPANCLFDSLQLMNDLPSCFSLLALVV